MTEIRAKGLKVFDFRMLSDTTVFVPIPSKAWDVLCGRTEQNQDCLCGPDCEPVKRVDGSYAYFYTHHSLDGREAHEAPYTDLSRGREFS